MENATTIFLIICYSIGLYIFVNLLLQFTKNAARNIKIAEARFQLLDATNDKNLAKEIVLDAVADQFDSVIAAKVANATIWKGMPDFLLIIAMGKPDKTRTCSLTNAKTKKWFYGSYSDSHGNIHYNLEVIVENNTIVGWKDLC